MEAGAQISATTVVWSKFSKEKVGGGFFSEEKHEVVQQVLFAIFDQAFGWARWEPDMLDSLVKARDEIAEQYDQFLADINKVLSAGHE